jgi:hypothetical protein
MPIGDDAFVIRGGEMKADGLQLAVEEDFDESGTYSLSVFAHDGVDVETVARKACQPHGVIRVSTVGRIREAGYDIANCDTRWHCDLIFPGQPSATDWEVLQSIFDPPIANPARARGCL